MLFTSNASIDINHSISPPGGIQINKRTFHFWGEVGVKLKINSSYKIVALGLFVKFLLVSYRKARKSTFVC